MEKLNIADGFIDKLTITGVIDRAGRHAPLIKFLNNPMFIHLYESFLQHNYRYNRQVLFKTEDSQVIVQMNTVKIAGERDFRIEFNPSKCNAEDMEFIKKILSMVSDKQCTRIDLCVNFHQDIMNYSLEDGRRRKEHEIRGRNGKRETLYKGSRHSDDYIKIYNKKQEQADEKDREIEHEWCRVEQTITGEKATDYHKWEWFKDVRLVNGQRLFPDDVDVKDKLVSIGIMEGHATLQELKPTYMKKIRKVIGSVWYEEEFNIGEEIKKTSIVSETIDVLQRMLSA